MDVTELIAQLNEIEDPRQAGKVEYPLQHLLLFALAATLSQYDSFELMASWSVAQGPWLIAHLGLEPLSRMPSHDTFRHLFRLLQPQHLERFMRAAASAVAGPLDQRLVLIDGKALCGTWGPKAKKDAAFKVLNAYLPDLRLTLGTHAVGHTPMKAHNCPPLSPALSLRVPPSALTLRALTSRWPLPSTCSKPITFSRLRRINPRCSARWSASLRKPTNTDAKVAAGSSRVKASSQISKWPAASRAAKAGRSR